jgi:hypothetical protein
LENIMADEMRSRVGVNELRRRAPVYGRMKPKQNDKGHRDAADQAERGQPESPESRETFAKREQRPGEVGLANEARPGLGTRSEDELSRNNPAEAEPGAVKGARKLGKPKATRYGYEEPRPEPREQAPNSLAHEEERSTGASGTMGHG